MEKSAGGKISKGYITDIKPHFQSQVVITMDLAGDAGTPSHGPLVGLLQRPTDFLLIL